MISRALIVSACMLAGAACLVAASAPEHLPPRESLLKFPRAIGEWTGREAPGLTPGVLAVLGVDEYVNRIYGSPEDQVGLYIGYYGSQREGDTIHSPLNCLPGAGWQPVSKEYVSLPVRSPDSRMPDSSIRVNQIVVQKGLDRQLVLYWYQSHGRVVPNEYWSKVYMVFDAVRLNRSDAALVRVVSPIVPSDGDGKAAAANVAKDFVKVMFPLLGKYLPS